MRSIAASLGTAFVIFMAWIAVWGITDTVTENLTRVERQRLYWGVLLAVVLIIVFNPKLLHRF
jgi:hypothetical protein